MTEPAVPERMRVGINYPVPFNHDGYGLGPRPYIRTGFTHDNPSWKDTLPNNLVRFKKMGVSVVRWFVLGNCLNYGEEPPYPIFMPGTKKWVFTPPEALDDPRYKGDNDGKVRRFEDHFHLMLENFSAARKDHEIQLLPSLIDFHAFHDPFDWEVKPGLKYLARGRHSILTDPATQDKFLRTVLGKFLEVAKRKEEFKKAIFAWEVMNEPHWNRDINQILKKDYMKPGIPDDKIQNFLQRACRVIEEAGFASTVGHRFYGNCLKFETGTIAQFHYYPRYLGKHPSHTMANPDPKTIPTYTQALSELRAKDRKIKDVFVGEFSCRSDVGLTADQGMLWPELGQAIGPDKDASESNMIYERLTLLQKKGYKLALVWPHGHGDGDDITDKLTAGNIQSLCRFTGGKF